MAVNKKYEYIDHLQEYMRERAKNFVANIGEHYPQEILELKKERPDRLIELLVEGATPILRGMEDNALSSTLARTVIAIRWSKQQAHRGKQEEELIAQAPRMHKAIVEALEASHNPEVERILMKALEGLE